MDYIKTNKAAWEEAFDMRKPAWGDDNHLLLKSEKLAFFHEDMKKELESLDLQGKKAAHFCCNNGRELLSLTDLDISEGVGFDFAENIIRQAKETAIKADITNCEFVCCNILDIPADYHNSFDFIFFTIGSTIWFEDLTLLLKKVEECLKVGGVLLINELHPFINMLALPGDENYDPQAITSLKNPYFISEPWVDNEGMEYMSIDYVSKPFTCFGPTVSDYINAIASNKMTMIKFNEYDYDIGLTDVFDDKKLPLSFIIIAQKTNADPLI